MSSGWPENSDNIIPYAKLSSVKSTLPGSGSSVFRAVLNGEKRQSVTLSILTVENEATRAKFMQEAALLKLLNHESLPQFIGITTVPKQFSKATEKAPCLAFITKAQEGVTLESYLNELNEKPARKKPYPYGDLLDVLIDTVDGLHYLHSRKPQVIHRGISTASIKVVSKEDNLTGIISTLRGAILTLDKGYRVGRLGTESFAKEALVSEELLTMEFFKPTLIPSRTSFPSPSRSPLSPPPSESFSPKPRPQSSMAIVATPIVASTSSSCITKRKKSDSRSVSFSEEVISLGGRNANSSLGSSQNNKTTPDPEHKVNVHKTVHVKKGVYVKTSHARSSTETIDSELNTRKKIEKRSTASAKAELLEESSQNSSKERRCSSADYTLNNNNTIIAAIAEHQSDPSTEFNKRETDKQFRFDSDSASNSIQKSRLPKLEEGTLSLTKDEIKNSEINVASDDDISDALSRSVIESKAGAESIKSASSQLDIYREDSMGYLKRQAGVILPPEILEGKSYDTTVDIFNFGLVMYKTLTKQMPTVHSRIKGNIQFSFPENFPQEVKSLIMNCCKFDAKLRPDAKEVGAQLRVIQESGCLNVLNKQWKLRNLLCFCSTPWN